MKMNDNTSLEHVIMETSDNNKFEFFNDTEIEKVRFIYIPDEDNEEDNIRWILRYKDFNTFRIIISKMSLTDFEDLKSLFEKIG